VATDVLPVLQEGVIPAEPALSQPIEDHFADNKATVLPNKGKYFLPLMFPMQTFFISPLIMLQMNRKYSITWQNKYK
jgi:hypothetical protein